MSRPSDHNFRLFLLVSDLLLTLVSLTLARVARLAWPLGVEILHPKTVQLSPIVYFLVALIWIFFFSLMSVYSVSKMNNIVQELRSTAVAILAATAAFAGVLYLSFRDVPRLLFIYFCLFDLIALLGYRILLRLVFQVSAGRAREVSKILILGAGKVGHDLVQAMAHDPAWAGEQVVGFLDDDAEKWGTTIEGLPVLGRLEDVCRVVQEQEINDVIFALPLRAHRILIDLVLDLQKLPVEVRVVPDLFDLAFARTTVEEVDGLPLISLRSSAINGDARLLKRVFDVALASFFLLLTAPVMAVIAIAIRLDSRGPIIFRQIRVGENGRLFNMFKFRTMVDGAEQQLDQVLERTPDGKLSHKRANDPRVTRLGGFLRRSSLDELPQLINVVKGEMSLVGPRPELPFVVEEYELWQRRRLCVPPGITGWWQISGRSEKPMHLHTEDDLYYIRNYSLRLDLHILLKTVKAVIKGRGAF